VIWSAIPFPNELREGLAQRRGQAIGLRKAEAASTKKLNFLISIKKDFSRCLYPSGSCDRPFQSEIKSQ
jgi:hypothetical protein